MKALMDALLLVACAVLASTTRLTLAASSLAWARVRERVLSAMASPSPGAVGMRSDRVRVAMGGKAGVCTLGEEVGVLEGTTLGAELGVDTGRG